MPPRPILRRGPPARAAVTVTPSDVRTDFYATLTENPELWMGQYQSVEDAVLAVYPLERSATSESAVKAAAEASWKTRSAYGWYKLSQEKAEKSGAYLPQWETERTRIQKMSVSMFNSKYDFRTTIKADDNGRERKFLDSVKDIWVKNGSEMQSFLEAKYYLRGARRSANESLTWAGKFDSLEPEENDSDYGEDLGYEEEGDEQDELDGDTLADPCESS